MRSFDLHNQEIEFVFENCESIHIDMWAIKQLYFTTNGERYSWDEQHKTMMTSKEIDEFKIVLDVRDTQNFHHTHRLIKKEKISEDGSQCIDRLRYCDDITHLYINGECFHMPWEREEVIFDQKLPIPCYKNKLQQNSEKDDEFGHREVTITISKAKHG